MICKICNSKNSKTILNKGAIPIWTGSSDFEDSKFICKLEQCTYCGHVFEEIPLELNNKLVELYSSSKAQASTTPGDGSWGMKRASFFLNKINYKKYKTAIEIGCADGYFLNFLENFGYETLVGIEPSLKESIEIGKIKLINSFADEKTDLNTKVDLIFSNAVFEHIENINGVLKFAQKHLEEKGELFFAVPNAQKELEECDLALFIHEHVH